MKRLTMLVTPDGQWILPDSAEFYAALGDPDPDYDAIAFAVKNLGFVRFEVIEKSIIEIELHPRNVQLPALLAVQQQLLSAQVNLFRIKHLDTDWESEISASVEHTIDRLGELCAPKFASTLSDRYSAESKDISHVFENEDNPFRPLAQKWRISFANFDSSIISLALRHQFLPRLAVIGVNPREPEPVFRFIGQDHRWVGQNYHLAGIGEKVAYQPDKEYGEWVSQFYKSVAATGQPRYDVVTALLHYENEKGRPERQVVYERLLLPWKTPSAEVFVTLLSRNVPAGKTAGRMPRSLESSVTRASARSS